MHLQYIGKMGRDVNMFVLTDCKNDPFKNLKPISKQINLAKHKYMNMCLP